MSAIRIRLIILLICIVLFLSGCWDRRDIEESGPILGLAIDFIEDKDRQITKSNKIKVTIQSPVPTNMESGEDVVWIISSEGESVAGAIDNLQNKINQELFFGHLQVIIFGQDIAKEGVNKHLNFFRNLAEVRRLSWIAVAKNKAEDIIKSKPKLEKIQAIYLTHMLNSGARTGRISDLRLGDFFISLSNPGQDPATIMLNSKNEIIDYIGLGVFKGDQLIGSLNQPESLNYQRVLGRGANSNLVISCDPTTEIDSLVVEIQEINSNVKPKLKHGKLSMDINLQLEAKIKEQLNQRNLGKEEIIAEIEQRIENKLKKEVENVIYKTQNKFQADIFGFGEYIRAYYPKYWQKIKWREEYSNMSIKVNVKAYIRQVGMINFTGK